MSSSNKAGITGPENLGNGFHRYTVNNHPFEVRSNFKLVKSIGIGAYGLVCSAVDETTKQKIAVKKCRNVFKELGDCTRVLRETKLLRFLRHENVLSLLDFYVGTAGDAFQDVYIVTEFFDADLNTVIRSKAGLTETHIKYFFYQILRGLKYVHSANVIHRDLKPANLLVQLNCDLKICDFGLARTCYTGGDPDKQGDVEMTEYVCTRWYRPPELLAMNKHYDHTVDVWAAGCIFAELYNRKPLFPGEDYVLQMKMVCQAIGSPSAEELNTFENEEARKYVRNLGSIKPMAIQELIPTLTDPEGQDFFKKMVAFDPKKRLNVAQLMAHPYMASLHDASDEPVSAVPFEWSLGDNANPKAELLRAEFLKEAALAAQKLK